MTGKRKMSPGSFSAPVGCMLLLFSMLLGCASPQPTGVYRGYSGMAPDSALAYLDLGAAHEAIIDDRHYVSRVKYSTVQLLAGAHRIQWAAAFGVSVMVEPGGYAAFETISNVTLEAGHRYRLSAGRTTGQGYKVYLWIEDTTTGRTVSGDKKP